MTARPGSLLARLWIYQAERFPVLKNGLLIAVFASSGVTLSSVLAGRTLPTLAAYGCAAFVAFGLFFQLRVSDEVKDAEELSRLREAARLGSQVMEHAIKTARVGMAENELAAKIEFQMRKLGAEGPSFQTIVASGARAALPHGRASSKRLKEKDLVVLDLGVILRGYCSDLTRTVHVGRASPEVRDWYGAVLEAQTAARKAVRAGIAASEVDGAVRSVLRAANLERYFIHSTGHGLGIEVHERPSLRMNQKAPLKAGSVVTIEPGIYLPGRGGIRIEDDVLVLAGGSETLTSAPRDLIEV